MSGARGGSSVRGTVVFAGYGWQLAGTIIVPAGTMIRVPRPHDGRLLDYHGSMIERTGVVPGELLTEGYWPGMAAPNLWLAPPDERLVTMATSITVTAPTPLSALLEPDMGACIWAACSRSR
jgi:hypothetical protein